MNELTTYLPRNPLTFGPGGDLTTELIAHLADVSLLDPRINVAVADFILSKRREMVDTGESKKFLAALLGDLQHLQNRIGRLAIQKADELEPEFSELSASTERLLSNVMTRKQNHDALEQLSRANDKCLSAKESASKIAGAHSTVAAIQQVTKLANELLACVDEALSLVTDEEERERVKSHLLAKVESMYSRY